MKTDNLKRGGEREREGDKEIKRFIEKTELKIRNLEIKGRIDRWTR